MSITENTPLDIEALRADFPILHRQAASGAPLVFLDNAASTQRPQVVIDSISECYEQYYANVHRGIHTLSEASTDRYEQAREVVAEFINSDELHEVIFTSGTTAAINTVARSWGDAFVSAGDTILLTMLEHHANIVPWHQLAERTGCRVEWIDIDDDGCIDLDSARERIAEVRPKLFAFSAVSNVLGTILPIRELCAAAREAGAVTLVDAAQAAPHMPIDVQQWGADFVVFSGHKLCGPNAIGVLYGRRELLDAMPPFLGGGAMIHRVTTEGFEPALVPEKFEAGTPPIVEAIGLAEAIRYVSSIGLEAIHTHELELTRRAQAGLAEVEGVRLLGPPPEKKSGLVSFVLDHVHAHDIAQWLDRRGVAVRAGHHCAMPLHKRLGLSASARASFYLYNTPDEVDTLISAVADCRKQLAPTGRRRRRRS